MSVNGIVLSRLTHLRDPGQITALVDSPYGMALLSRLMALYNGAALTVGTAFTQSNTITLFRMSGSTLSRAAAYGGTVLRDRLPHYAAKLIYSDLLEVITAVRTTPAGVQVRSVLLGDGTAAFMPEREVEVVMNDFVEACRMRLGPQLVRGPPQVEIPAPNQSESPESLMSAIERRVGERFARALDPNERRSLEDGMIGALSHHLTADLTSRRSMLGMRWVDALALPAPAQLWASVLETLTGPLPCSVTSFADRVTSAIALVASLRFVGGVVNAEFACP